MDEVTALKIITNLSHEFGTPDYVKGGGGNTSVKTGNILWIKPSGTTLSGLKPESFVPIDRGLLYDVYDMQVPDDAAEREEKVKRLMMNAVMDEAKGRPSVETPLHDVLRATYVVHTHPILVNGMTCAKEGAAAAARLFPDALWIPYTDPGFILSLEVKKQVDAYRKKKGHQPAVIFLENHGVFVAGDTPDEVRDSYTHIMQTLTNAYESAGVSTELIFGKTLGDEAVPLVKSLLVELLAENARGIEVSSPFQFADGPLTPDHMVYAKAFPLVGELNEKRVRAFNKLYGYSPRIIATHLGVFAVGTSQAKAEIAMELAKDGSLVRQLTQTFGGVQYLDDDARQFIEAWEVESYRENMLKGSA